MIYSLVKDVNPRGHSFEKIAKPLLRRSHKNSFIFCTSDFTDANRLIPSFNPNSMYNTTTTGLAINYAAPNSTATNNGSYFSAASTYNDHNRPIGLYK